MKNLTLAAVLVAAIAGPASATDQTGADEMSVVFEVEQTRTRELCNKLATKYEHLVMGVYVPRDAVLAAEVREIAIAARCPLAPFAEAVLNAH